MNNYCSAEEAKKRLDALSENLKFLSHLSVLYGGFPNSGFCYVL